MAENPTLSKLLKTEKIPNLREYKTFSDYLKLKPLNPIAKTSQDFNGVVDNNSSK